MSMANCLLAKKYGSSEEQMLNLHAALSFSREADDVVYLSEAEARNARRELFKLQVANQYFREAIDTYDLLAAAADKEATDAFAPIHAQLTALASDDKAFSVPITLDERGSWDIRLLKRNVYIRQPVGKVNEFKVRCDPKYVGFAVEPEVSYNLPGAWGPCSLEILGEPGSAFDLVQH